MKYIIFVIIFCATMGNLNAASYSFNGQNFTQVSGEYTLTDNIFGGFITTVPIDPNAGVADVTPILISYQFFDGVQMLDDSNSKILAFRVSVDDLGYVDETAMTIWRTPVTTVNGGNVQGIDMYRSPAQSQMFGFKDGICGENNGPGGECTSATFEGTNSGIYSYFDLIFSSGFDF